MTVVRSHKVVAYAVEQPQRNLRSHKVVAYAAEQPRLGIRSHKAVGYAVEQFAQTIRSHKVVAYAVEQFAQTIRTHKIVGYGVEQFDMSGNLAQRDPDKRPAYRTGPLPHIEFGPEKELYVFIFFSGEYLLVFYKPDNTFETRRLSFVRGENLIPAINFNQLVILPGNADFRLVQRVKLSMRLRALP